MNRLIYTLLLQLMIITQVFGQGKHPMTEAQVREIAATGSEIQVLTNASMLMQEDQLYYSDILTDRLLTFQESNPNYNYRKGFLILKLTRDFLRALPYFEVAVKKINPNFDMYSTKENAAPTDAFYHLAQCYHYAYNFDKAEENYNLFLQNTRKQSELIPQTRLRLQQLKVARTLYNDPIDATLKNLGPTVNSAYPEFSSVVSFDGSALYFTSRRPWEENEADPFIDKRTNSYLEDIYVSYLEPDSSWSHPSLVDFCIPQRNEATIGVSTDERRMYIYEDKTGNGDIYYSDFFNNQFNEIRFFDTKDINSTYWETHIFVSPDASILVFSSDRPGGHGGRDLYISYKNKENGKWSKPVNMGPAINGPYDDDAPFISVDNNQLYFATNDGRSMGDFDILLSERQADGSWGVAKNIGYPFNSTSDDIYYTTTVDGYTGYITSYRSGGHGEKDIYQIRNSFLGLKSTSVLLGKVTLEDGSLLPSDIIFMANITCMDCEPTPISHIMYARDRDGKFMTGLQPCKTYRFQYLDATDNTVMGEETFKTECVDGYFEIERHIFVNKRTRKIVTPPTPTTPKVEEPEKPSVVVETFKNLDFKHYFEYNKNKLTVKKGKLKEFVLALESQFKGGREKITITIESSASHVPTKTYGTNEKLANLRAENMKYDLIEYFEKNKWTKGKVVVVISQELVQGPVYENDAKLKEKYKPYQYVFLKTE